MVARTIAWRYLSHHSHCEQVLYALWDLLLRDGKDHRFLGVAKTFLGICVAAVLLHSWSAAWVLMIFTISSALEVDGMAAMVCARKNYIHAVIIAELLSVCWQTFAALPPNCDRRYTRRAYLTPPPQNGRNS
jgi:hypothetical protein